MEQKYPENLSHKRRGVITMNTSTVSFMVLCVYLALTFICYIDERLVSIVSLTLYGFVALMLLSIVTAGWVRYDMHMLWYALFTLVCAFSCVYAYRVSTATEKTIEVVKLLIFSVMFLNAVNSKERIRTTVFVIMVSCFVLFINLAATDQLQVDERLGTTLVGNANAFASMFMIGAISSVYFLFFSQKRLLKVFALVILILQLYALALSGSRKYFMLPVLLLSCLEMVRTDKNGRKHLIRNFLIGIAVIIGVWWALFNVEFLYNAIGYRMEGMMAAFTGEGEADASTKVRMNMINIAIRLWKEKPLLGHGLDNYQHLNNLYVNAYAHNNYAELLATLGLVGLIAYYWYYVYLIVKLIKAKSMGVERWYWALAILSLAIFDYGAVSYAMYPVHFVVLQASVSLRQHSQEEYAESQENLNDEQDPNAVSITQGGS